MASTIFSAIHPPVVFTKALDEGVSKTILQIASAANNQTKLIRWGVFFNEEVGDASSATPLKVELYRHSSADGTGVAIAAKRVNATVGTQQASVKHSFSAAPTNTDLLDAAYVNPQSGYEVIYPFSQEIILAPNEAINIVVTAGSVLSTGDLSVFAKVWFEE
jgi:regulator of extracellular matrix RemA (YlzA/DUF370 family)